MITTAFNTLAGTEQTKERNAVTEIYSYRGTAYGPHA